MTAVRHARDAGCRSHGVQSSPPHGSRCCYKPALPVLTIVLPKTSRKQRPSKPRTLSWRRSSACPPGCQTSREASRAHARQPTDHPSRVRRSCQQGPTAIQVTSSVVMARRAARQRHGAHNMRPKFIRLMRARRPNRKSASIDRTPWTARRGAIPSDPLRACRHKLTAQTREQTCRVRVRELLPKLRASFRAGSA